jgi:hypothetical protein
VLIENIGSIIRREGACYFFLDKKVTKKSSQQRGFFAARAFPLQSGQNHGLGKFAPCFAAHPPRFSKHSLCPSRRTAQHVLPAFARSFPAAVF